MLAKTHINVVNLRSKTSTLAGDTDVTGYGYGAGSAGPHAVTSATIDGVSHTLGYDLNGAVTTYDIAGTSEDKYLAYNAFNQPVTIVIGASLSEPTPEAKDEFAYGPNGQRYARKTVWKDGGSTYTEEVAYIGAVEVITDDSTGSTQTVTKTRLSSNVMHVKIVGTGTEEFFEYAHRDHLGSIEAVTDDNGNVLDQLAFEPFGSRKGKDWTSNISATEQDALLSLSSGHARKARGFTGHEHLDRTGFIHMNGRVFDPVLGRFLSPDPIVQAPTFSQHWNRYSYVFNTPTSFTDPSGFCPECPPREIDLDPGDIDLRRDDYSRNERGGALPPHLQGSQPEQDPYENEVIGQTEGQIFGSPDFAVGIIGAGVTASESLPHIRNAFLVPRGGNGFLYYQNPAAFLGPTVTVEFVDSPTRMANMLRNSYGIRVAPILNASSRFLGPAGASLEVFDNTANLLSGRATRHEAGFRLTMNSLAGLAFAGGPIGWAFGAYWMFADPLSPEGLAQMERWAAIRHDPISAEQAWNNYLRGRIY